MLYLIRDHDYLKIGYADNVERRLKEYRTHTLYTELLDTKPGLKKDETALHNLCKDGQVESEGFENCQEVIEIGNNYKSDLGIRLPDLKKFVETNSIKIKDFLESCLIGERILVINPDYRLEKDIEKVLNVVENEEVKTGYKYYKNVLDFVNYNNRIQSNPEKLIEIGNIDFNINPTYTITVDPYNLIKEYKTKIDAIKKYIVYNKNLHLRKAALTKLCLVDTYSSEYMNVGTNICGNTHFSVYERGYYAHLYDLENQVSIFEGTIEYELYKDNLQDFIYDAESACE